ncbi:MAG: CPBP family intramembrane metalloprotease [Planctomycetales bacterium]|nr:CPBP family intramembrane metalloprotease [Planctomycetales bacterium]
MSNRLTPVRLLRLCLKELRESLRDRRTIVTLVLMPLLVYPLLSLVLNRVLLTGMKPNQGSTIIVGVSTELRDSGLPSILVDGQALLYDRQLSPVYLETTLEDQKLLSSSGREDGGTELPSLKAIGLSDDGRSSLRDGSIDLLISRRAADESEQDSEDQRSAKSQFGDDEAIKAYLNLIGTYEVRYRKDDQRSERALQIVERVLAAINNRTTQEVVGRHYSIPFRLQATPVVMKSDFADLLATMIPLVLVLMTMAGAVYPAIDLTAGERERGTMEALIVSPTPLHAVLFAKYVAVVTVALLTALANLGAMTLTLWVSGISKLIFGDGILSAGVIGTVLALLVLFTMFFAALLLAITSFAKSFKEAQAYLIPLMLLALTPGIMSLLPDVKFSGLLATVPLVNIVLLARQVLVGSAEWHTALISVTCTGFYALAALAVAGKLFGSDASMHGSQGSWRDLLSRPKFWQDMPRIDQMAMTMAVMFPLYFVASSLLPRLSEDFETRLSYSVAVSFALILFFPLAVCWFAKIRFTTAFRLGLPRAWTWPLLLPATLLVASSAWMFAHELVLIGQSAGIGTIGEEQMEFVQRMSKQLQQVPLAFVLFALAITPAVCEEFLFRGMVLSSMHRRSALSAIVLSAVVFGLMHVLTSNVLAVERFLPSTYMGLILGWIALRTGSLWPGMVVHCCHNGLLLAVAHYQDELIEMGIFVEEKSHLPSHWLIAGGVMLAIGILLFWFCGWGKVAHVEEESN